MRWCLALAWLLGFIPVLAIAADGLPVAEARILRANLASKNSTAVSVDVPNSQTRRSPTFTLRTKLSDQGPRRGDIILVSQTESSVEDSPDGIGTSLVDDLSDPVERGEQIDSSPASTPRPLTDAVPLDGAFREDEPAAEKAVDHIPSQCTSLGWIAGTNNQLGMVELDFEPLPRVSFDPTVTNQGYLSTTFGAKWLSGPSTTDLPPQLFNILINVGQVFRWREGQTIDAMISPGWYTDFSNKGVEAFRLPWHLVSYTQMGEAWYWALGVTDLSRRDIRYLPVVGIVVAPKDGHYRLDLVFPKPQASWRLLREDSFEHWFYVGGELGGGSWAISREDRSYDVMTYRDLRLVAGFETRAEKSYRSRLEVGWVFDRSVQYQSEIGNYNPPDSLMVRMSSDY